jgi:DNA-binding transcriptional regulator YiaG
MKGTKKNVWYILTDVDDPNVAAELGLSSKSGEQHKRRCNTGSLESLRVAAGLTLTSAGAEIAVHGASVSRWESGEREPAGHGDGEGVCMRHMLMR